MKQMAKVSDVNVRKGAAANFASGLVEYFKMSTIKIILAYVSKIAAEWAKCVPNIEMS